MSENPFSKLIDITNTSKDSSSDLPVFAGNTFEHLNSRDETIDQFVPVKGKMCPYGGWCVICMNKLTENAEIPKGSIFSDFFRDYPGHTRSYHGGLNYCKSHIGEKEKYEAEQEKAHKKFMEDYEASLLEKK